MTNKIKVLYLNVQENKPPEVLEIESENDVFHRLIGCDSIDIVRRYISGKWYRVICDDEGRLKPLPKLSMCDSLLEYPIAGNIIIAGMEDRFGELTGLSDADAAAICDRKLKWMAQWVITQADTYENKKQECCTFLKKPAPSECVFIPLDKPKGGDSDA